MKKKKKSNDVIKLSQSSEFLNLLRSKNISHKVIETRSTKMIEANDKRYLCSSTSVNKKDLGFIKKVKDHVTSTGKPMSKYTVSDINYFKYSDVKNGSTFDVCEIDVNKAYWNIAKRLGYIDKVIFNDGMTRDKMTRLIALGSMASIKSTSTWNTETKEYLVSEPTSNPVTRSYFFHISKYLDDVMNDIIERVGIGSVYFYWVDAFFVKKSVSGDIADMLYNRGLEYSIEDVHRMKIITTDTQQKIYIRKIKERTRKKTVYKEKIFSKTIRAMRDEHTKNSMINAIRECKTPIFAVKNTKKNIL